LEKRHKEEVRSKTDRTHPPHSTSLAKRNPQSKASVFTAKAAVDEARLTRKKHDTGFYHVAVDYCLAAEGISLEDIDLVVRNCYVLPVETRPIIRPGTLMAKLIAAVDRGFHKD
jgi:Carbamoyltransferase N-terminus